MKRYFYSILVLLSFSFSVQAVDPPIQIMNFTQNTSCLISFRKYQELQRQVLFMMTEEPHISPSEMAERLNLPIEAIRGLILALRSEGKLPKIKRRN